MERRAERCLSLLFFRTEHPKQSNGFPWIELAPLPAAQERRQAERPEAHAHQAAHGDSECLEHAPDLAVAPFAQHDLVPAVRSGAAARLDAVEPCRTVLQHDPARERQELLA